MHVMDAAYAVVHDYPGGSVSLAPRMGMSAAILRNKVNPNNTTHHLTLQEAIRLVTLTNDRRLAHAIALELGGLFLDNAEEDGLVCDMAVLEAVTAVFSRAGAVGNTVHAALSDRRVTRRELAQVEREVYGLRVKAMRLVRRMVALMDPDSGQGADGAKRRRS